MSLYVDPRASMYQGLDGVGMGVAGGVVQGCELIFVCVVDPFPPLLPET